MLSQGSQKTHVGIHSYERYLVESVQTYLRGYQQLGLTPPVAISLALLGHKGSIMHTGGLLFRDDPHPIDRDVVVLPDVVIDDLNVDVPQVMKPIFDAVWNACGFSRSFNYDEDGKWNPKRV